MIFSGFSGEALYFLWQSLATVLSPMPLQSRRVGPWRPPPFLLFSYSSSLRTARNASVGSCTEPRLRIFFLPAPQSLRLGGDPSLILHARGK